MQHALAETAGLGLARAAPVPLPHQRFRIEQINGALHEDRSGHPRGGGPEGLGQHLGDVAVAFDRERLLDHRSQQSQLLDVLERTAALEDGGGGPAEYHHGRLGHGRVFEGGDRVGDPRPGRHRGHAGHPGQPGHGVGGEYGIGFVTHVDHAQAALAGGRQNGGNVAAAEGKHERNPAFFQKTGNGIAAVGFHRMCLHGFRFAWKNNQPGWSVRTDDRSRTTRLNRPHGHPTARSAFDADDFRSRHQGHPFLERWQDFP